METRGVEESGVDGRSKSKYRLKGERERSQVGGGQGNEEKRLVMMQSRVRGSNASGVMERGMKRRR